MITVLVRVCTNVFTFLVLVAVAAVIYYAAQYGLNNVRTSLVLVDGNNQLISRLLSSPAIIRRAISGGFGPTDRDHRLQYNSAISLQVFGTCGEV